MNEILKIGHWNINICVMLRRLLDICNYYIITGHIIILSSGDVANIKSLLGRQ